MKKVNRSTGRLDALHRLVVRCEEGEKKLESTGRWRNQDGKYLKKVRAIKDRDGNMVTNDPWI